MAEWAYKYLQKSPGKATRRRVSYLAGSGEWPRSGKQLWPVIFSTRRRFKWGTLARVSLALAVQLSWFRSWRLPTPTPVTNLGERAWRTATSAAESLLIKTAEEEEEVSGLGRRHRSLCRHRGCLPSKPSRYLSRHRRMGWQSSSCPIGPSRQDDQSVCFHDNVCRNSADQNGHNPILLKQSARWHTLPTLDGECPLAEGLRLPPSPRQSVFGHIPKVD